MKRWLIVGIAFASASISSCGCERRTSITIRASDAGTCDFVGSSQGGMLLVDYHSHGKPQAMTCRDVKMYGDVKVICDCAELNQ